MSNKDNLIPQAHKLTVEEQSRGGKASAEARREKRDLKKALELLLERDFNTGDEVLSGAEAISVRLFQNALNGDIRAFEVVRDTAGQKPAERLIVSGVDQTVIEEVERMVLEDCDD